MNKKIENSSTQSQAPISSPSTLAKYPNLTLRQSVIYFLRFLNAVNPNRATLMTDMEVMFLAEFLILPEKFRYNRFSKVAKRRVIDALKEARQIDVTVSSINPKLYSLVDKGVIKRDDDGVMYIKDYIVNGATAIAKAKAENSSYTIGINFDYT